MATIADRLSNAANRTALDQAEVARLVDTTPRTVARWLSAEVAPRPEARERLLEILAVLDLLSSTLTKDAAHDWLFTPNPSLDHHKPAELLSRGEYRRVLGAIDALAEGVFV